LKTEKEIGVVKTSTALNIDYEDVKDVKPAFHLKGHHVTIFHYKIFVYTVSYSMY